MPKHLSLVWLITMENSIAMDTVLKIVVPIIKKAGQITKEHINNSVKIIEKPGGDLATETDLMVSEIVISSLLKKFPEYGIISEEAEEINSNKEFVWVLDPIDGSKHYAMGNPIYSISLALKHHNEVCIGIVYSPSNDELFVAVKSKGAYLNKRELSCSPQKKIEKSIICVEIPSRHANHNLLDLGLYRLKKLIYNCQRIRILGVSSLSMCYCASGRFDAYVNLGSAPNEEWDYAGGKIVLQESGCLVSSISGTFVSGNKHLHDNIIKLLF